MQVSSFSIDDLSEDEIFDCVELNTIQVIINDNENFQLLRLKNGFYAFSLNSKRDQASFIYNILYLMYNLAIIEVCELNDEELKDANLNTTIHHLIMSKHMRSKYKETLSRLRGMYIFGGISKLRDLKIPKYPETTELRDIFVRYRKGLLI